MSWTLSCRRGSHLRGACHLILAAATRRRLAGLDYEFERLKALMLELELTTVDLVWRDRDDLYHVRNPFPVGGVYEDPATGAGGVARPPAVEVTRTRQRG